MAKKKARKEVVRSNAKVRSNVKASSKKGRSMGLAIVALILNVLIIPGLGTLVAGKIKPGVWQLVLAIVGFILSFVWVGIPILIAAWIWGLVTGIKLIQESG